MKFQKARMYKQGSHTTKPKSGVMPVDPDLAVPTDEKPKKEFVTIGKSIDEEKVSKEVIKSDYVEGPILIERTPEIIKFPESSKKKKPRKKKK